MYTNEMIQDILNKLKDDNLLTRFKEKYFDRYPSLGSDYHACLSVIRAGWYEGFDRYDSEVCEKFLKVWEDCES